MKMPRGRRKVTTTSLDDKDRAAEKGTGKSKGKVRKRERNYGTIGEAS